MSDFTSTPSSDDGGVGGSGGSTSTSASAAASSKSGAEMESTLTAVEIVQRIHAGQLAADAITAEQRQQCVSHLALEGFATGEIAALLRVSERTIQRDRLAVRRAEALAPGLSLGDELLGEYQRQTLTSIQRLTRMIHDHSNPAYARLWAEEAINRIYQRFLNCVHQLQYLESGQSRLYYLRQADPATQERDRQNFKDLMSTLPNLMASVGGGKK